MRLAAAMGLKEADPVAAAADWPQRPGGPADAESARFVTNFAGEPQAVKYAVGSSVVHSPVDVTRWGYFMEIAKRVAASPEGSGQEPKNLDDAIYEMCRQDFWRRLNEEMAALQSDPEALAEYEAEVKMFSNVGGG